MTDSEPLLDPQLLTKEKVAINTSTSKFMYSFGKANRFKNASKTRETLFYDLPTVFNKKGGVGLGYGTRSDFTKALSKGKADRFYDIPREFDLKRKDNTPKFTFGYGREECKRSGQTEANKTPGPGTYSPGKKLGADALKFSIFGRTWNDHPPRKKTEPGPGTYKYLHITPDGKYPVTTFENTRTSTFSKSNRFNYVYNKNPGPTTYYPRGLNLINGTGVVYPSQYQSFVAKTMTSRPRDFSFPKYSTTPGPGSYEIFSDFEGFSKLQLPKKRRPGTKNKSKITEEASQKGDSAGNSKNQSKNLSSQKKGESQNQSKNSSKPKSKAQSAKKEESVNENVKDSNQLAVSKQSNDENRESGAPVEEEVMG